MKPGDFREIGQHLQVKLLPHLPAARTCRWDVIGQNNYAIGQVKWYSAWRRYCFFPEEQTCFDSGCLADIAKFLDAVKDVRLPGEGEPT